MVRNLNVFFVHSAWLKDRERVLEDFQKQVSKYTFSNFDKVDIKIITDYDPNDINGEIIQRTVNYTPFKEEDDLKDDNKTTSMTFYNQFIKNMHLFQLSNNLKHKKIFESIAEQSSDQDINLVLEDDVVYEERMCMMLEKVIDSLPPDYDITFMGLPTNKQITNRNDIIYQNTSEIFRVLPYCDSYIVSKSAAAKLSANYYPIKFTNNIQMSYLMDKLNLKTVFCVPSIFIDGSKFGMFLSTLTPNNALLFNNDYMQSKQLLESKKKTDLSKDDTEKLDKIFTESQLKNHPDFLYIKAQYLTKQKKYKEAESVYTEALRVYQANSCVLNHESLFLKDYIRLYKELQVI
jgi:GR25 family glycosyltransferase involved in LPS biosynthesis